MVYQNTVSNYGCTCNYLPVIIGQCLWEATVSIILLLWCPHYTFKFLNLSSQEQTLRALQEWRLICNLHAWLVQAKLFGNSDVLMFAAYCEILLQNYSLSTLRPTRCFVKAPSSWSTNLITLASWFRGNLERHGESKVDSINVWKSCYWGLKTPFHFHMTDFSKWQLLMSGHKFGKM